jgi:AraC-like DNA-binding protein
MPAMKHFDERRRDFAPYGLTCELWEPVKMPRPDRHDELEINFLDQGSLTYMLGGKQVAIPPRTISLFWAAIPHQIVGHSDLKHYYVMTVPLGTFLRWGVDQIRGDLVTGRVVSDPSPDDVAEDLFRFRRWTSDLQMGDPLLQKIVLMEVEARVARLSRCLAKQRGNDQQVATNAPNMTKAEQMATFVARHFTERIQLKDIAEHVDLHPDYASTLFKRTYGVSLTGQLIRYRIAEAQRLLVTTDEPILEISLAAGFDSLSGFNRAFKDISGVTPREYRKHPETSMGLVGV